jgi:uncharacterized RDD family membrane protein YckC
MNQHSGQPSDQQSDQQPDQHGMPSMPQPAPSWPAPGVGQPADLMSRFLARLIDYVLLFVVNMVFVTVVVVGAIMGAATGVSGFGARSFGVSAVSAVLGAAIYLAYFAVMESSRGQTVGKMVMKLQTQGPGGQRLTMEQALKRNAWTALGIVGIVPFIGWFVAPLLQLAAPILIAVTISNNATTRQGWHDTFAGGTRVIKVG